MRRALPVLLLMALVASGCRRVVADDLSQEQALHVAASLQRDALDARVVNNDGHFGVAVHARDRVQAVEAIVDRQLLRPLPGPQTAIARNGLDAVHATRRQEDERAADIAHALELIPGVQRARVTLSLCDPPARSSQICPNPNQLSALVRMHADASPPDAKDLREWLAASVPQLDTADVRVLVTYAETHTAALPAPPAPAGNAHATAIPWMPAAAAIVVFGALAAAALLWRRRGRPSSSQVLERHLARADEVLS